MKRRVAVVIGAMVGTVLLGSGSAFAAAPATANPSDFNGDGHGDLAIGAPREAVGLKERAGAVTIIYGSDAGLAAAGAQRWSQSTPGIKGTTRRNELFGTALASGDFDADGHADLAIGVPNDNDSGLKHAGVVDVLYGSAGGLTAAGMQRWSEGNLPGKAEERDHFGASLASGDFDGDGFWDLAIGLPNEDLDAAYDTGAVEIVYGGPDGLSSVGAAVLTRASVGQPIEESTRFATRLAAGDFDGDAMADLAISEPWVLGGGEVGVVYGDAAGLGAGGGEHWSQGAQGILGDGVDGSFGLALATGDFDANGRDDLAIGAPSDGVATCGTEGCDAGAVAVLYGTVAGLSAIGNQLWTQDSPGVPGMAGDEWLFGNALAAADFDGDGADELAIGAPADGLVPLDEDIGSVTVLRGSPSGLTAAGSVQWLQSMPGVPGGSDEGNLFGWALAAHDLGRNGRADLAITALGDQEVIILFGTATGLGATTSQIWSQDKAGIPGSSESGDQWGSTLAP